ncbi:DUF2852 domain-containing protein [Nitrobacter sp.]|uniref:DUF2852 domain-containing protein n=1 Tax=Nitrobacter sp. TaxID=29420 RepID=UPI003F65360A
MAQTTDYDRWNGPNQMQGQGCYPYSRFMNAPWHPLRIVLIVLGFMVWWPIGLAILFFTLGSRKMGCWSNDRFENKMQRMQSKMDRMRDHMERRGFGFSGFPGFGAPSSGNRAFDEYRMETLRRLEEEQKEFKDFLERLRHAKDKEEFDAFMAQHRTRPTPPNDQAQGQ